MEVISSENLSYHDFCERFMATNTPVRILDVCHNWSSFKNWRNPDGSINFGYLKEKYGTAQVPVVDGGNVEYGNEKRFKMRFDEYLDRFQKGELGKLYLKDWHFCQEIGAGMYETPVFFRDDWLNWWWDQKAEATDDYRFVYFGPQGSWTPMHQDVLSSFSWSVNVCGQKEWIFYPPQEAWKLKDRTGRFVIADVTRDSIDREMFPNVQLANGFRVVQEANEAIFVPSGWYHQVVNLQDTISINHNWFNGFNLRHIWSYLQRELSEVVQELKGFGLSSSCDFRQQCQMVMHANTGMNYEEFEQLLRMKKADPQDMSQEHYSEINSVLAELKSYLTG